MWSWAACRPLSRWVCRRAVSWHWQGARDDDVGASNERNTCALCCAVAEVVLRARRGRRTPASAASQLRRATPALRHGGGGASRAYVSVWFACGPTHTCRGRVSSYRVGDVRRTVCVWFVPSQSVPCAKRVFGHSPRASDR